MACTGCGSSFSLLKKEVGCEVCGFSFCSKCCSKRSFTTHTGEALKQHVCNQCYDNLVSDKPTTTKYSPPLAYKKRMAKLESRSLSLGSSMNNRACEWGNEKDKEIADRLQKLKRERTKEISPSQLEIEERLAKLKGMDPAKYTAPPIMVYRPSGKGSSIQQTDDLLKQVVEELQIDAKREKPEDEIAARLAHLRGVPVPSKPVTDIFDPNVYKAREDFSPEEMDISEENSAAVQRCKTIVAEAYEEMIALEKMKEYKKALERANNECEKESDEAVDDDLEADEIVEKMLSVKMESLEMDDPESLNGAEMQSLDEQSEKYGSDDDEFPWCVICTEDAKIRCFGCDSDLYCMNCFRECHDSLEIRDHRTCPYLFRKKL